MQGFSVASDGSITKICVSAGGGGGTTGTWQYLCTLTYNSIAGIFDPKCDDCNLKNCRNNNTGTEYTLYKTTNSNNFYINDSGMHSAPYNSVLQPGSSCTKDGSGGPYYFSNRSGINLICLNNLTCHGVSGLGILDCGQFCSGNNHIYKCQ